MSESAYGNPAQSLIGIKLDNGWIVKELIKKKPEDTGGHFSVGYLVEKQERKGFLKALDLTAAFEEEDFTKKLESLTSSFNFERDLLYKCKNKRLSKIVTPIAHGTYSIPGQPPFLKVFYIIFEYADKNLRNQIAIMKKFDLAWILRSLHHTSIGLKQLHSNGIAHQDLKPSNVLVFKKESMIGDLGRSSDIDSPSRNDKFPIAGDRTYAPIDLFYGNISYDSFIDRFSTDLYHLGSLIFFYFMRLNLQQIIWIEIKKLNLENNLTKVDYEADLPYFQIAFNSALDLLKNELDMYSTALAADLIPLVKMLCNPEPEKRGHIVNVESKVNKYGLERFISKFDLIAKKAEFSLYGK